MEIIIKLSQTYGSGNLQQDLLVICAAIALLLLPIVLLSASRTRKQIAADGFERISGIAGRLEKLEMTLNSFRSDSLRSIELFKQDVSFVKQELSELKKIGGGRKGPTGGSEPSGGGSSQSNVSADSEASPAKVVGFSSPASIVESKHDIGIIALSEAAEVVESSQQPTETKSEPEELSSRLKKSRVGLFGKIRSFFSSKPKLDAASVDELEAQLVSSDLGVRTVTSLIDEVKRDLTAGQTYGESELTALLKRRLLAILEADVAPDFNLAPVAKSDGPLVVMMVGVNGVGKTTTTAKLSALWKSQGAKVLLVAADTFRAAAVDQLVEWGNRIGVPVVSGPADAKPQTVVFEAMQRAQKEKFDVILIDTAGRLHTKTNLMQELEGVRNAISRHQTNAPHEVLLVVDGSTGQNALAQAREFNTALRLTGLVVTKLDGTPKGGIVIAIKDELGIPVRFIGVGESAADLRQFNGREFIDALFNSSIDEANISSAESPLSAHAETRRRKRREQEAVV